MKVKVISGFCLGAGGDVYPGDVIELEDWNARRLIGMGFVVQMAAAPAPALELELEDETLAVDVVLSREPEPENREPRIGGEGE